MRPPCGDAASIPVPRAQPGGGRAPASWEEAAQGARGFGTRARPAAGPPTPAGRARSTRAAPGFRLPGCEAVRPRAPPARPADAMGPERCLALGGLPALAGLLEGRLVRREEAGFGE